jgi:hypothetical protein
MGGQIQEVLTGRGVPFGDGMSISTDCYSRFRKQDEVKNR